MINLNQFYLIGGVLLVFSVLLLAAGYSLYRNQKKKPELDRTPAPPSTRAGPPGEPPVSEEKPLIPVDPPVREWSAEPPRPPAAGDPLEIMRVYRRPVDGSLSLQVMGRSAEHVGEMTPGQVEQLKKVVREIAMWVENKSDAPSAAGRADPAGGAPVGFDERTPPPAAQPQIPPGAYFADTLPPMPGPRDLFLGRRKKPDKAEEAPAPPRSIAAQIDEILQSILISSPLRGREIRLSEDPGGGLKIIYDTRTVQAIDDVEDEAVRALIKQAVQVWNERNRLG